MKAFKDSEGKEWILTLNIGAVKRLRDLAKIDLTALNDGDPPLITRLSTDIVLVCDVLFVLCKVEADKAGISDEQFAARLDGDAIRRAWEALQESLIDFFRQLGRPELARVIEANRRMVMTQMQAMEAKVDQLGTAMEKRLQKHAAELDVEKLIDAAAAAANGTTPGP